MRYTRVTCPCCEHEFPIRGNEVLESATPGFVEGGTHYGRGRDVRPDQADPELWSPNADGTWRSPGGRTFQRLPEGVALARQRRGLPMTPS